MKKLVRTMAALVMVAGVVGFMGCKQATGGETENKTVEKDVPKKVRTEKINNVEYDIVEFGIWPQTKYSGDESKLKPCEKGINTWEQSVCFTDGTDNYIKVTAAPHSTCKSEFTTGSTYYFKLEPIQWRVLTNDYKIPDGIGGYKSSNNKLLFAEKALAARIFYKDQIYRGTETEPIYPNNYKESDIKNYLNNDFINKAFTQAEIAKIQETDVDNSWQSTFGTGQEYEYYYEDHEYDCANTKDKIFLLSTKEVTTAEYGFDAYDEFVGDNYGTTTSTRIRKTTDYARATGASSKTEDQLKLENSSVFWLRSPYCFSDIRVEYSNFDGDVNYSGKVDYTNVSVVPAFAMNF